MGGLGAVVAAVAVIGLWYFMFRDDSPPPVDLDSAVAAAASATTAAQSTGTASTSEDSTDLAGTWQVVPGSQSFVGYRVQEELATVGAATAVGRTSEVTGTLEFDGASITAVSIEADLTALRSDSDRRDGALRQQALETNSFPAASFNLTEPIQLDGVPEGEETIDTAATGELTLHGVTRQISLPLQGRLVNGQVVVVGSTEIVFADYDIEQPSAASVLSVEDHGTLEVQLVFERA
jgi:polyisoprenoid-binding protein YceI